MSEQAPRPQPTPEPADGHKQIADTVKQAGANLPEAAVLKDYPYEGMTRVDGNNAFVQLSEGDPEEPDVAIGSVVISGSIKPRGAFEPGGLGALGRYGFRSTESQGVKGASVRREIMSHDTVTRAGAAHRLDKKGKLPPKAMSYEHDFRAESRDKAGKLIAGMAVKQAARDAANKAGRQQAA